MMSIFYCRLAKENTKRVYQFLKKELGFTQENDYHPQSVCWENKEYTFCFRGEFVHKEVGEEILKKRNIHVNDDREYLIALYCILGKQVKAYMSHTSFLLIDDGNGVFIYSGAPLYYARKRKGEIFISTEKDYIGEAKIFELNEQSSLFFFNNNLKTLG